MVVDGDDDRVVGPWDRYKHEQAPYVANSGAVGPAQAASRGERLRQCGLGSWEMAETQAALEARTRLTE